MFSTVASVSNLLYDQMINVLVIPVRHSCSDQTLTFEKGLETQMIATCDMTGISSDVLNQRGGLIILGDLLLLRCL